MIDRATATAKQYAGHAREPSRPLSEPSRDDLRRMLSITARNTAALCESLLLSDEAGQGEV